MLYLEANTSRKKYYPFGMVMEGRRFSVQGRYRYGFNTQEKEPELGEGITSAEFWVYDGKLGRRWNVDPVIKAYESPYSCLSDNPIFQIDFEGDDPVPVSDRKLERGVRKYGRKFNRFQKRMTGQSNLAIHRAVQNRYNKRRWMWVRMVDDEDGGGTGGSEHSKYRHIGDEFQERNPQLAAVPVANQGVNLPANQNGSMFQNAPAGNMPAAAGNTYNIIGSGQITFQSNIVGAGTWTLSIWQDNNPGVTPPDGAITTYNLNGSIQLLGPTNVSNNNNLNQALAVNINNGANIHFVYTNVNGGGLALTAAPPTPLLNFAPALAPVNRNRTYTVVTEKGHRNTHKLNRHTRKRLIGSRTGIQI